MRIVIETTGSEQLALQPEEQSAVARPRVSAPEAAMDGGAPGQDLLLTLGERASAPPARKGSAPQEPYIMPVPSGEPARH
jgi:hypothetical protein